MKNLINTIFWLSIANYLKMSYEDVKRDIPIISFQINNKKRSASEFSDKILEAVKLYRDNEFALND